MIAHVKTGPDNACVKFYLSMRSADLYEVGFCHAVAQMMAKETWTVCQFQWFPSTEAYECSKLKKTET